MNCIKFFPLKLRNSHGVDEIRGPYFPRPRKNTWIFGDCSFRFYAPWSNSIYSLTGFDDKVRSLSAPRKDILSSPLERFYFNGAEPPSEWCYDHFYTKEWYFVGPWFSGFKAGLASYAYICTAKNDYSFGDKNLFHPRVFESAIVNHLEKAYGYEKVGKKPHYRAPLNWKLLPVSESINAVVCDLHCIGNSSKDNPTLDRMIFFPVSRTKFVRVNFSFGGTPVYRDEIGAKSLFGLCDTIIGSMRLEVGPQAQAEWDKVKETCPDMSITETMGEFQWPLKVEKKSKKPKEVDITPDNEPKPVAHLQSQNQQD